MISNLSSKIRKSFNWNQISLYQFKILPKKVLMLSLSVLDSVNFFLEIKLYPTEADVGPCNDVEDVHKETNARSEWFSCLFLLISRRLLRMYWATDPTSSMYVLKCEICGYQLHSHLHQFHTILLQVYAFIPCTATSIW